MEPNSNIVMGLGVLVDKVCRSGQGSIYSLDELVNCVALVGDMLYSYRKANETLAEPIRDTTTQIDSVGSTIHIRKGHVEIADLIARMVGVTITLHRGSDDTLKWDIAGKEADVIVTSRLLWLCLDRWNFLLRKSYLIPERKKEGTGKYLKEFIERIEDVLGRVLRGEEY